MYICFNLGIGWSMLLLNCMRFLPTNTNFCCFVFSIFDLLILFHFPSGIANLKEIVELKFVCSQNLFIPSSKRNTDILSQWKN